MATTCSSCGASSATSDYCDSCGAALAAAPAASTTPPPAAKADDPAKAIGRCPHCDAVRTAGDEFCEVCGLDFKSGQLPSAPVPVPAAPAISGPPSGWTATVEIDADFYATNEAEAAVPVALPRGIAPRDIQLTDDEVVIGRRSDSTGLFPQIDLASPVLDPAVSHRHAVLRRQSDGSWSIIDEGSTNGTWLNSASDPLARGTVTALRDGDHINVGSFTRITFRHDR